MSWYPAVSRVGKGQLSVTGYLGYNRKDGMAPPAERGEAKRLGEGRKPGVDRVGTGCV